LCTKENTQNNVRPKYKDILFWLLQLLGRIQHIIYIMLFHTGVVTQGFLHWSSCIGVFTQEFLQSFFTGDLSQEFLHRSFCTGVFAQEFLHRSSYTGVLTQEFLYRSFTQGFFSREFLHRNCHTGVNRWSTCIWSPTQLLLLRFF
jgi:hypothetical protein